MCLAANVSGAPNESGQNARGQGQPPAAEFVPAHLVAAWPIEYPIRSVAAGVVVLEIAIDDNGKVVDAIARRDIPSLTAAALLSVKHWEYKAALRDGEPVWSRATVAVMFGPPITPGPIELPPLASDFRAQRHRYPPEPPDLVSVFSPAYPTAYIGIDQGVVFSVTVGVDGTIESSEAVHGVKGLTGSLVEALKRWQFQAAKYDGKPIVASLAIGFVYRVPVVDP